MARAMDPGFWGGVDAGLLALLVLALAAGSGLAAFLMWRMRRNPGSRSASRRLIERVQFGLPAGVLVVVVDLAGRVQFASQKAMVTLGLPEPDALQGKVFTSLACWDEPAEARHALARALLKAEMGKPQSLALSFGPKSRSANFIFELHPLLDPRSTTGVVVITALEMSSLLGAVPAAFGTSVGARASAQLTPPSSAPVTTNGAGPLAAEVPDAPRSNGGASRELIDAMFKLLPTSKNVDEALKITASYLARLFPGSAGTLFMPRKGASGLHGLRAWGGAEESTKATRISADECWALRHGALHWVDNPQVDLICSHHAPTGRSACLPLSVRGELVGVLSLAWRETAVDRALLESFAEPLASALAQVITNVALREQATRDPLTGLLNRQALEAEFGRLLKRAEEDAEPASVLMIDIDHFKAFNDRFGHDAGDLVLKNVAARVNQAVRARDLAFRYGGEEMLVLLPCCGIEDAVASAQRIQKGLTELTLVNRGERLPPVTISVGVATFPNDGLTAEALFRTADAGVYAAKAAGRNTVVHPVSAAQAA